MRRRYEGDAKEIRRRYEGDAKEMRRRCEGDTKERAKLSTCQACAASSDPKVCAASEWLFAEIVEPPKRRRDR